LSFGASKTLSKSFYACSPASVQENEFIPNQGMAWNPAAHVAFFFLLTRYRHAKPRIIVIESKK